MTPLNWTEQAEVVVIGGGIIGCSVAYHLARAGVADVLLVERLELAAATTARSAGQLSFGRTDVNMIRMAKQTQAVIPELENEIGASLDFQRAGNLRLAFSSEREAELTKLESVLVSEGVNVERLDRRAAGEMCPWLDMSQVRASLLLADAGHIDGPRLAMAYAQAARARGVRLWRGVEVEDIVVEDANVVGVRTSRANVRAKYVVDAAGAWSPQLARSIGWYVAAVPTRSHFWITAPNAAGAPDQPNVSLPDFQVYTRREMGGLLIGFQEPVSRTFDPFGLAPDLDRVPMFDATADLELLGQQLAPMRDIVRDIDHWQFAHHIAGLSTYTPDGKFLIGRFAGLSGFLVATGCCGSGVLASAGIGQLTADLILDRAPSVDATVFEPDRFGPVDPSNAEFHARCAAARAGKSRSRAIAA